MFLERGSFLHDGPYFTVELDETYGYIIMFSISSVEMFLSGVLRIRISPVLCLTGKDNNLGDNYIQKFHLGRYVVRYTVGNLVLRRRVSGAVKCDFRTYIRRYTSPNENFEYGYPHSNPLLTFSL